MIVCSNKWAFSIKTLVRDDGSIAKILKARLKARGLHHRLVMDFGEMFGTVVKAASVRILVKAASSFSLELLQTNAIKEFWRGVLEADIHFDVSNGVTAADENAKAASFFDC